MGRMLVRERFDLGGSDGLDLVSANLTRDDGRAVGLLREDDPTDAGMLNHAGMVPRAGAIAQVLGATCTG